MKSYKALLLAFLANENQLINRDINKVGSKFNITPEEVENYMKQLVANKPIMMTMLMGRKIEEDPELKVGSEMIALIKESKADIQTKSIKFILQ